MKKIVNKIKIDKLQSIIIIIVVYFSICWYLYPFLDKKSIFPLIITSILVGLILLTGFVVEVLKAFGIIKHQTSLDSEEIEKKTIEIFIRDEKREDFLEKSSRLKLYTLKGKWVYDKVESTYIAVFYHKLKNNNYFTREMNQRLFSEISKDVFDIEVNQSTITHYKKNSEKFIFGRYEDFYDIVLSPFGDK